MVGRDDLPEIVDDALLASIDHQFHLIAAVGSTPNWSYRPGRLELSGAATIHCAAQVVGTVRSGMWRWGWADRQPPDATAAIRTVRQKAQHPLLCTPEFRIDSGDTATQLVAGVKPMVGWWTSFAYTPHPEQVVYTLINSPLLELGPARASAVANVIAAGAEHLRDVRRGVRAYAEHRRLPIAESRNRIMVAAIDGQVLANITESGRLNDLVIKEKES